MNASVFPRTPRGVIVVAVLLTAFNLRTGVTGFTAIAQVVEHDLWYGPATTGALGTIVTACFAASAFAAPRIGRRLGLERSILLAVVLTSIGLAARAIAPSTVVVIVSTIVAFAGVGISNVLLIPAIREHFPDRAKTMSTAYMLMLQIGQFVAPVIAVTLSERIGWRLASTVWPALTSIAAALWIVTSTRISRARQREEATETVPWAAGSGRQVEWRSPFLWGLVGLMGMTTLHTYSLVTWLPSMFGAAGLAPLAGASLLSAFAAVGIGAALIVPTLVGSLRNPFPIVVACVVFLVVGYVGMLAAPATIPVVWALALGLGVSTFPLVLTLIGSRSRHSAEASALSGVVQGIGYAIGCIGPILLGVLDQSAGSWSFSYTILLGTLLITLVAGWFACRPHPRRTS